MKTADSLPPLNEDSLYDAQSLAFDAWEEPVEKKRIALAKKALKTSPYCADGYNILAEEANDIAERVRLYAQGVEMGKMALGKKFFKQNEGHFWGIIETRPFMRSMEGLADCLWEQGERQKAIETYQEMLRLNPNDNQGVRYVLIGWLISRGAFEAAEELLATYPDRSAFMLYGAALLYFMQGRKVKARNALKKAIDANPHVPEFLLNPKKKYKPQTAEESFGYRQGYAGEANEYRCLSYEVWRELPGALDWLKGSLDNTSK
ncbi:MAG: tetratricopeptide repeat protein [Oscillospiraceae bacterium]|jgi:tetratricopeptide (TPR) repeat protein|nr:tetratricopeptide repeat protein [Oscillospiraceae bacterium]